MSLLLLFLKSLEEEEVREEVTTMAIFLFNSGRKNSNTCSTFFPSAAAWRAYASVAHAEKHRSTTNVAALLTLMSGSVTRKMPFSSHIQGHVFSSLVLRCLTQAVVVTALVVVASPLMLPPDTGNLSSPLQSITM